jgi:hypothetical protein
LTKPRLGGDKREAIWHSGRDAAGMALDSRPDAYGWIEFRTFGRKPMILLVI